MLSSASGTTVYKYVQLDIRIRASIHLDGWVNRYYVPTTMGGMHIAVSYTHLTLPTTPYV